MKCLPSESTDYSQNIRLRKLRKKYTIPCYKENEGNLVDSNPLPQTQQNKNSKAKGRKKYHSWFHHQEMITVYNLGVWGYMYVCVRMCVF